MSKSFGMKRYGCSFYLDQELCDPQLARGMTRIRNDVQSNLGPRLLQCPRSRRLTVISKRGGFQKGMGGDISDFDVQGIQRHIVLARLLPVYDGCERKVQASFKSRILNEILLTSCRSLVNLVIVRHA
jgi:hypothetical protein